MARPPKWHSTLDASVAEACLAVRLYNDPAEPRCFEAFTVHMHLAWLYLLHASFIRDDVDYRYRDATKKRRLVRIDGEPKRWELQRSVEEHWPDGGGPAGARPARRGRAPGQRPAAGQVPRPLRCRVGAIAVARLLPFGAGAAVGAVAGAASSGAVVRATRKAFDV